MGLDQENGGEKKPQHSIGATTAAHNNLGPSSSLSAPKRKHEEMSTPMTTEEDALVRKKAKILAMQQSIQQRLAEAKKRKLSEASSIAKRTTATDPARAPSVGKTIGDKMENPYLSTSLSTQEDDATVDVRVARSSKLRQRNPAFPDVKPGTWQEMGERQRMKAASLQSFVSGRKQGHSIHSTAMTHVYGPGESQSGTDAALYTAAQDPDRAMPLIVEWWDMPFLPPKLRKQVASLEQSTRKTAAAPTFAEKEPPSTGLDDTNEQEILVNLRETSYQQSSLSYSKTATLVQHIVPIKPTNASDGAIQPVIYLTKQERKRQRKLRRQEKQREVQDLQSAGLVPAPEPRLTLSNFMRVLGEQASLDPSQMEQKVREQIMARQTAHLERNAASQLTKEERAEKRRRKLTENTSQQVHVAVFYVLDVSHRYHRTKLHVNSQQFQLTGGVVEVPNQCACVIVEGGPKAIQRYKRLLLVRMNWTGEGMEGQKSAEDNEIQPFNPKNKCLLIWEGMAAQRNFRGFLFQQCTDTLEARRVLEAKGLAHYWDQVEQHHHLSENRREGDFQLKLAFNKTSAPENPYKYDSDEEDTAMKG